jgi:L,D-transpeptidase catalytic domain
MAECALVKAGRTPIGVAIAVSGVIALAGTAGAQTPGLDEAAQQVLPEVGDQPAEENAAAPDDEQAAETRERGARAQRPARLKLDLERAGDGRIAVGERAILIGRVRPFVPGQRFTVLLNRNGRTVQRDKVFAHRIRDTHVGRFEVRSPRMIKPGGYRFYARHRATPRQDGVSKRTNNFKINYPDLDPGQSNSQVRIFNNLLERGGYYTDDAGSGYGSHTERAVLAFRKVNGMERTFNASPEIFRTLAAGDGEFKLAHPEAGRHVEIDISRQVMVLADDGKAEHTFHVSTGAPATPSDRGTFRFYSRQPGFNSVGMYYSIYYNGGEATHGYHSVPTYPASHGCIRNPIPDSVFIYNWVELGMTVYVYD